MFAPMYKKLIIKFIDVLSKHLFTLFVSSVPQDWPVEHLQIEEKLFVSNPLAFYTVDVQFQQTNYPSGNHIKSKPFFQANMACMG